MANLNRIILIGKIQSEPESRTTVEGIPMTKFSLSVSRMQGIGYEGFGSTGADVFDVVAWRKLAEHGTKALKKGQKALVEGRIQIRTFNDQTGQKHWATEIVAKNIHILDGKQVATAAPKEDFDLASDLPF